jgi:flavodoxin
MKILTVYYSWSNGNTKKAAEIIQKAVGGDMEEIEMETPYQRDYDEMVSKSQEETARGFTPKVKPLRHPIKDYDLIFIGTPTWWYTMASPVLSFLKGEDWTGKKAAFFMTNAGWPGHVIKDMEREVEHRGGQTANTLEIRFDSSGGPRMETPEKEIEAFAKDAAK